MTDVLSTTRTPLETVTPLVDELAPRLTDLADAIWAEPELRWEEHRSVAKQVAVATELGASVTRDVAGIPTAFTAQWGTTGPVIAFLGEYDALASLSQAAGSVERAPDPGNDSGNGQGCGHHLLGSGSLLAAAALARHLEAEGLPGVVRYYGCPAEEGAAGKSFMVTGGAFQDVDVALTWHPGDGLGVWQALSLAYTQLYFRFRGLPAHAGANPQHGRSALDAAELMNVGVNFLREHMEDSDRVHYAFTDAGGPSANVVQPTAELYYIVRSATVASMRTLCDRVRKIAEGAALMTETEVEVVFDGASSEVLPNPVLEEALHVTLDALGGVPFDEADQEFGRAMQVSMPDGAVAAAKKRIGVAPDDDRAYYDVVAPLVDPRHREQMTGSTDVGDVSWVVPTVQVMGGTHAMGTPGHSWQMVAQGTSSPAHKGMVHVAKAIAALGLELLSDPELLERARAAHAATTAVTPYDCPIPEGAVAPPLREGYTPA
ncbi:amidohydrolase [Promicromonospora sp. Marseille-Q5078]